MISKILIPPYLSFYPSSALWQPRLLYRGLPSLEDEQKSGVIWYDNFHQPSNTNWSDGCIVIKEEEILKIWKDIIPKNGKNITVIIGNI